ncbi:NAD(+)--dinitrogen-reductase ADP-D-ribosyltransferase [Roseospira visakhapatnamensis]|uniref:NAD+--dinitrogen-reductase ADP-D-ribosyltransferase n=1 Tax=Roseospira visakhapatnamensis TaxID=390880 RepID=A0A7W6RCD4_9PROT|nr:NAD(+)--dinitrogen-reductase ADP-D-ribosyltransferase [Roseospira visakhapatnamensis]MBB4265915.1 NAD+--dinitrogen-reductase ADP-D-ribosyltransferase [Roseospira visakhapatnamensis]
MIDEPPPPASALALDLLAEEPPRPAPQGHSSNMVGIPTAVLASPAFNLRPRPLDLPHVRPTSASLFEMLDEAEDQADAVRAFHAFMAASFCLEAEQRDPRDRPDKRPADGTRRFRSSYLRLLRGWVFDTGNAEGAVLKGWVESRFGLLPTWHGAPIRRIPCPAWVRYVEQKMSSRFHDNAIHGQLDLVFTFCQWMLRRFGPGADGHLVLYRGVTAMGEDQVLARHDKTSALVRFNNLTSFTSDRSIADCFGDRILTVRVPATKVVFFDGLLPRHPLKGEAEYLVLGGDYVVRMSTL